MTVINRSWMIEEAYRIIGLCMEVHGILDKGHSEVVYKDALEYEFQSTKYPFQEKKVLK